MKKLVVCGDSFAKGIGCRNLETEPYGSLVAKSLGLELVNIAKGSSTNYSIFAQVLYAIENIDDIDMILVTSTSYDRVEWFKHNENPTKHQKEYLTNYDINYHEYPPYMPNSYTEKIEGEQHIMSEDLYNGNVFTENLLGIKPLSISIFIVPHIRPILTCSSLLILFGRSAILTPSTLPYNAKTIAFAIVVLPWPFLPSVKNNSEDSSSNSKR